MSHFIDSNLIDSSVAPARTGGRSSRYGAIVAALVWIAAVADVSAQITPIFQWQGTVNGSRLGYSMANAGDIDGGGDDDLLVGAPEVFSPGGGIAYVYRGEDGTALATFPGQTNEHRGGSVSPAGDLNGDGVPDILIGSSMPNGGGRVEARSYNRVSGTWTTLWSRLGNSGDRAFIVDSIGDVNGDGRPDVLVGAYGAGAFTGRAELVSGADGALIRTWTGSQAGTHFGVTIAGVQDVDGDGKPDVLIGAPQYNGPAGTAAGRLFLYSGGQNNVLLRSWDGMVAGDNLGAAVQRGPDVDHDGLEDVLVGASMLYGLPAYGPGKAFIYSIRTGALLRAWVGATAGDYAFSISRVGDVNGDSVEDISIGSEKFDGPSGTDAGRLDVYSGRDLGRRLVTINGSHASETLGSTNDGRGAVYAGDLNHDGYADFAVASFLYNGAGSTRGRVQVFAGDPFPLPPCPAPSAPAVTVTVPAQACPFLALQPPGVNCCLGASAPSESPVQVPVTVSPGATYQFTASGSASYSSGCAACLAGPEGHAAPAFGGPYLGLGGYIAPTGALVGVFMPNMLNAGSSPPTVDYSSPASRDANIYFPAVSQIFYIGDGLRNNGMTRQSFVAPAGATALFLGFADGVQWSNNSGGFTVTVQHVFSLVAATSGGGTGDLTLNVSNIPATATNVLILASAFPAPLGIGTGPVFGLVPDLLFLTLLLMPSSPGCPAHFPVSASPYAAGPLVYPGGSFSMLAGQTWEVTALAYEPFSAGIVAQACTLSLDW